MLCLARTLLANSTSLSLAPAADLVCFPSSLIAALLDLGKAAVTYDITLHVHCAVSHDSSTVHSGDELFSDRSLAVFTELACVVRSGARIEAAPTAAQSAFGSSRLTTMLQDSFGNGRRALLVAHLPEVLHTGLALDGIRYVCQRPILALSVAIAPGLHCV